MPAKRIWPLLDRLELSAGLPNWGYRVRFGLVPVGDSDPHVIALAMAARIPAEGALLRKLAPRD